MRGGKVSAAAAGAWSGARVRPHWRVLDLPYGSAGAKTLGGEHLRTYVRSVLSASASPNTTRRSRGLFWAPRSTLPSSMTTPTSSPGRQSAGQQTVSQSSPRLGNSDLPTQSPSQSSFAERKSCSRRYNHRPELGGPPPCPPNLTSESQHLTRAARSRSRSLRAFPHI
jgi:hypothetical protein